MSSWGSDWAQGRLPDRLIQRFGAFKVSTALSLLGFALGCIWVIALRSLEEKHPFVMVAITAVLLGSFSLLDRRWPILAGYACLIVGAIAASLATGGL